MGILSDLKRSLSESPGRILWEQLQDAQLKMRGLSEAVRTSALIGFSDNCSRIAPTIDNMTRDGRIKLGRSLQDKGKDVLDMNVSEGYSLWLTGAWLESMNRQGLEAARTFEFLNRVAMSAHHQDETVRNVTLEIGDSPHTEASPHSTQNRLEPAKPSVADHWWRSSSYSIERPNQSSREKAELRSRFEPLKVVEKSRTPPELPSHPPPVPQSSWGRIAFGWIVGLSPLWLLIWYYWFR